MDLKEFLVNKLIIAVSNYKITPETEHLASQYDLIIRFNSGSNPSVLKKYPFYNGRTDISVISGWERSDFGSLESFKNQKILFSRPKCVNDIKYHYKQICVKQQFEDSLKNVESIDYIPLQVFYDFYDEYLYDHPTTGLITIYYISKILKLKIDCINFYIDDNLYNTFINSRCGSHNIELEKKIFKNLDIRNIITQ